MKLPHILIAAITAMMSTAPAVAQTWTAQPPSDNWDAAAVAQWDSGAAMVARCHDGDFRLITLLVAPFEGMAASMSYTFDEGETQSRLSALAESGAAVFARHPAEFAREFMSAQSLDMTIDDGRTRPQRYILQAPGEPQVLAEVLTACGEPLTSTRPPAGAMITNPDWIRLPSGSDLAALYPDDALRAGTGGAATIQCLVAIDGSLEECLPVSEEPEGGGFDVATIAAAQRYRMRPMLVEGEPVGGALVELTIRWQLDGAGVTDRGCYRGSGPGPCEPRARPRD